MSKKTVLVSLCALVLVLTGALAIAQNQKAAPTSVVVADVQKLFDALDEKNAIEAKLQSQADKLKQEEEKKVNEIKQLQADIAIVPPGTPAYRELEEKLETKAIELQAWRGFQTAKLNRERAIQMESLYRKMVQSMGDVAKQRGAQLVLFKEPVIDFRNVDPKNLPAAIQMRKVLWASAELDVTDQVIQLMNTQYKNSATPANP